MPDYNTYTIEDLARDAYFRHSVLRPDSESDAFWQIWILAGEGRRERFEKARLLVIALENQFHKKLPETEVQRRVGQLLGKLDEVGSAPETRKSFLSGYWWRVAAVLIIGLGFMLWIWRHNPKDGFSTNETAQIADITKQLIARENTTKHSQTLILSDSSIVTLFPGSKLQFPKTFSGESRKVTLTGDAFFEVTHDGKPFLVYAGETVTRVWGTQFRVTAFPQNKDVKVSVKSGKVSVHKAGEFILPKPSEKQEIPGVMLTRHEQVVFDKAQDALEKTQLTDLKIITQNRGLQAQVFVDTPVTEVFKELENMYGIEIQFDERVFADCKIITSFRGETLIERVNSICQAIDASFEPAGGGIVISGRGCGK
ncbi:FecR family protein [Dyadobacter sp.]|uniref:FecR family protein n=1 Tax=Dyadobacter sp. TaxID=1914288 RepID=UPI003F72129E